jgi:hypothetical protein
MQFTINAFEVPSPISFYCEEDVFHDTEFSCPRISIHESKFMKNFLKSMYAMFSSLQSTTSAIIALNISYFCSSFNIEL